MLFRKEPGAHRQRDSLWVVITSAPVTFDFFLALLMAGGKTAFEYLSATYGQVISVAEIFLQPGGSPLTLSS